MAEFAEVMKQKKRMCEFHKYCNNCPMQHLILNSGKQCELCIMVHPQQTEEIIMKWAEEHPVKTNADKFKEVFGAELYQGGCVGVKCPSLNNDEADCKKCKYYNFWEREYKEPKGEDE